MKKGDSVKPTPCRKASRVSPSYSLDRRGFTLIEVMAAVVIFSIVLTAVFATFNFQAQSYTTQSRVAEMQQNLRMTLDTLQRDIRMAGYGIYSDITVPLSVLGGGSGTVAFRGFYAADGGAGAPDNICILYTYDVDDTVTALASTLTTSAVSASGPISGLGVTLGTGSRFTPGSLVILSNSTSADLYQVTGSDNNSITFGSNDINAGTNHMSGNFYFAGSKVSLARFVRYYIDTTIAAHPTLMVSKVGGTVSQPLAEEIEDLQFRYGVASTSSDPFVSTIVDSPSTAQLLLIRRIQLSIIARSEVFEKGWSGQRTNIGNRTGTAPTDQYRRRVVDNVAIDLRNLRFN
jgi:type IV pilus assembly protein PilW